MHITGSYLFSDCFDRLRKKGTGFGAGTEQGGNESEVFVEDPYWPENEYTKQISKPDFEIISAGVDEIGFFADFASSVTTKDVIAYADVVKNSGFNIDVEIDARAYEGESRYLFLPYNKAGYFVEIYWYSSGSGMAMRK